MYGFDMARLIPEDKLGILTVAQEALMEPFEGKLAVAEVIHNRMKQKYMSDGTVEGTVLKPYQFSGWLQKDPVLIKSMRWDDTMPAIQECIKAWFDAKQGSNTVAGAVLYYAPGVVLTPPKWALPEFAVKVVPLARIFDHLPLGTPRVGPQERLAGLRRRQCGWQLRRLW